MSETVVVSSKMVEQYRLMASCIEAMHSLLTDRVHLYAAARAAGHIPAGVPEFIPIAEVLAVLNAAADIGNEIGR